MFGRQAPEQFIRIRTNCSGGRREQLVRPLENRQRATGAPLETLLEQRAEQERYGDSDRIEQGFHRPLPSPFAPSSSPRMTPSTRPASRPLPPSPKPLTS